jgi:uncharacterized protein
MIDPELLEILCCPQSRQPLAEAPPGLVATLNQQVGARTLRNQAGKPVEEPLEGGLIREDGRLLYPIRHRIPVLLVDEAIPLDGPGA